MARWVGVYTHYMFQMCRRFTTHQQYYLLSLRRKFNSNTLSKHLCLKLKFL